MKLYIIIGAALVVVAAAVGGYFFIQGADQDTARITGDTKKELSQTEMKELSSKSTGDFQTAMAASEQAGKMGTDEKLTMWKTQLSSDNPAVRLKAAQELVQMEGEAAAKVVPLLEEVSKDEKADKESRMLVQKHLGKLALKDAKGDALIQAATKQLEDPRVGVRWAAVDVLAEQKCEACKAALAKVAKDDADEDLRMVAEMLLEEMASGGAK